MEGCLLARKNILIEKEFPNGYLCGEKDHVTLQYRSSRGFPTLDEAKQAVDSFSNPENFFYVQFRKSWYPVYTITNAVVIVVGKSFFCYGSSSKPGQPYLTYVEKKVEKSIDHARIALGGLSRSFPSICGVPMSSPFVDDVEHMNGERDVTVVCGRAISALQAGSEKDNVLAVFGYAMFDMALSPFQMEAVDGYFIGRPSSEELWANGYKAFHPVTGEAILSEQRKKIILNNHAFRAYTLNEWVESSSCDEYQALVDKRSPAWV